MSNSSIAARAAKVVYLETRAKPPNLIDVHVGDRVRLRRKLLHMSQQESGDLIDLTFQQVQKYERGTNRISASKLFEISRALKCRISLFFDGLPDFDNDDRLPSANQPEAAAMRFLQTSEGVELAQAFPRIPGGTKRRRILELVKSLADD